MNLQDAIWFVFVTQDGMTVDEIIARSKSHPKPTAEEIIAGISRARQQYGGKTLH